MEFYYAIDQYFIGPRGVRALPLAAGTNEGGHYFHSIFLPEYNLVAPEYKLVALKYNRNPL